VAFSDAYNNPPAWQPANATDGQTALGAPVEVMPTPGNGWHADDRESGGYGEVGPGGSGRCLRSMSGGSIRRGPKDFPARRGFGFPRAFASRRRLTRLQRSPWSFSTARRRILRIRGESRGPSGWWCEWRFVRVTATPSLARSNDYNLRARGAGGLVGGSNVARSSEVTSLDSIEAPSWARRFLVRRFSNSQGRMWPCPNGCAGCRGGGKSNSPGPYRIGKAADGGIRRENGFALGCGLFPVHRAALALWLRRRARAALGSRATPAAYRR